MPYKCWSRNFEVVCFCSYGFVPAITFVRPLFSFLKQKKLWRKKQHFFGMFLFCQVKKDFLCGLTWVKIVCCGSLFFSWTFFGWKPWKGNRGFFFCVHLKSTLMDEVTLESSHLPTETKTSEVKCSNGVKTVCFFLWKGGVDSQVWGSWFDTRGFCPRNLSLVLVSVLTKHNFFGKGRKKGYYRWEKLWEIPQAGMTQYKGLLVVSFCLTNFAESCFSSLKSHTANCSCLFQNSHLTQGQPKNKIHT